MGTLTYSKNKFYFTSDFSKVRNDQEWFMLQGAGFKYEPETLRWVTRSAAKAVLLRRFADEGAERKLKNIFITTYKAPESIIYPDHLSPKSFQLESAWHALTRSPSYIADEAGLGKTITAILCMNTMPGKTLIICPPFLKYNWENEIRKWATMMLHPKAWLPTVAVVENGFSSKEVFEKNITILPDSLLVNPVVQKRLSENKFKWLFVDEAHRYKEATTQRTKALIGEKDGTGLCIADAAERICFLSGTPLPNGRPIELFHLLDRIAPESIGHRSYEDYGKLFCNGKRVVRYEGRRDISQWDFSGVSNLETLSEELYEKLMVRHLKKDVLKELGPKTRQIIFLDTPKDLKPYEKKVLANHTLDDLMGEGRELGDISSYRRQVGTSKIIPAFTYIHELLEHSRDKLVVFAHHIEVVETLTKMLKDFHPLMIRGGMTAARKAIAVREFQNDPKHRAIIGNMDAMGTGNTLTASPQVIVVEPSWVPGTNEQAEDRIYRMTQKQNVYVKYLVLRDSLDERMLHSVLSKQDSIDKVLNQKGTNR